MHKSELRQAEVGAGNQCEYSSNVHKGKGDPEKHWRAKTQGTWEETEWTLQNEDAKYKKNTNKEMRWQTQEKCPRVALQDKKRCTRRSLLMMPGACGVNNIPLLRMADLIFDFH